MSKQQSLNRQTISLDSKIKILDSLISGEGSLSVCRGFGLNEATVRTIKNMRVPFDDQWFLGNFLALSSKTTSFSRNSTLEKTERHMGLWSIVDLQEKKFYWCENY